MTPTPLCELHEVTRSYGRDATAVHAVRDVRLTVYTGELLAIVGPSGSGKTTLLQLLGAMDRPTGGTVLLEGRDLARLGDGELAKLRLETVGFVFQQFNLIPTLTAAQNVEAALAPRGRRGPARKARAAELLDAVGLAPRAGHLPAQLSGGEQQRVAIARALANEPHLLLADEPTGNLDSETGAEIVELLGSISAERGTTVVIVTHDEAIASRAHRVVRMQDGRVVSDNERQAVPAGA